MSKVSILIDLDGVICRSSRVIPGAPEFIRGLQRNSIPFLFLTNNSAKTPEQYSAALAGMGIHVPPASVYTSGQLAIDYLQSSYPHGKIMAVAEDELKSMLRRADFDVVEGERPDLILVAEVRHLSYPQLCSVARYVRDGVPLVATNPDDIIPSEDGFVLGCGSVVRMIEAAAGTKAYALGKPNPLMALRAAEVLHVELPRLIMIGDSLNTDIQMAVSLGIKSVLVLSGVTNLTNLKACVHRPSAVIGSVADLIEYEPSQWFPRPHDGDQLHIHMSNALARRFP